MKNKILIIGGAGFIGSNLAQYFLNNEQQVTVFDNFSRFGSRDNAQWLKDDYPHMRLMGGDIRKFNEIKVAVSQHNVILHLAAQVAVTTSVADPRTDFEINALGTFNVLEAVRIAGHKPFVIFSSTNKVYGGMEDIAVFEKNGLYAYQRKKNKLGISEKSSLDFHSPYGCSKGAADQYVHDYGRIYDFPTVVFRQSCIYGPRQFGIEDQGWVAWFIIATMFRKKIRIYGDGMQVRDVLYVTDLVRLFDIAIEKREISAGKIYNVGGGYRNILSVWSTFGPILMDLFERKIEPEFADWRPGDQKIYVSDIRKVRKELGWSPQVNVTKGIKQLYNWVKENKKLFVKFMDTR